MQTCVKRSLLLLQVIRTSRPFSFSLFSSFEYLMPPRKDLDRFSRCAKCSLLCSDAAPRHPSLRRHEPAPVRQCAGPTPRLRLIGSFQWVCRVCSETALDGPCAEPALVVRRWSGRTALLPSAPPMDSRILRRCARLWTQCNTGPRRGQSARPPQAAPGYPATALAPKSAPQSCRAYSESSRKWIVD